MNKKIIDNEKGQSSVEFIISFIMVVGFVFMYVQIALNFTNGYLVHYSTFMSSRAFMVYEGNSNTAAGSDSGALGVADDVWKELNIESIITGPSFVRTENMPGAVANNVFVGLITTYQDRFSIFSAVGTTDKIEFKSESFLGRETTIAGCVERVCESFSVLGISCGNNTTVMDNGC